MTLYTFPSRSSRSSQTAPRKSQGKPRDVTGRDPYIIAESLIRYIVTEQAKPDREQSWSNLQDARAIFNAFCGAKNVVFFADHYPGVTINLVDEKAPRDHSE